MPAALRSLGFRVLSRLLLFVHPLLDRDQLIFRLEQALGPFDPVAVLRTPLIAESPACSEARVSVIIPVKNGGAGLVKLLERLRSQRLLAYPPEILVVDSGSSDGSPGTAERLGASVIPVPPSSFNHGATRNLAAERASGDILLFITQDALPDSDLWLLRMVSTLTRHETIAAASCVQTPADDADLFARWLHSEYVRSMGGARFDFSVRLKDGDSWNRLSSVEKGRTLRLDNVALCIRKAVFAHHRFSVAGYGEDMELAARLLKSGATIAFLQSVRILHSHNRPAEYFMRRAFVEERTVRDFVGPEAPERPPPFSSGAYVREALRASMALTSFNENLTLPAIRRALFHALPGDESRSSSLSTFLDGLTQFFPDRPESMRARRRIVNDFFNFLRSLWLFKKGEEPREACHKLLGFSIGRRLASLPLPEEAERVLRRGV